METTIVYWGLYGDNGKENGNHYIPKLDLADLLRSPDAVTCREPKPKTLFR